MRAGATDGVSVGVEAADGQVAGVEVHGHHRPGSQHFAVGSTGGDAEGLNGGGPGGSEVDAGTARLAGERVGDGLAAGDAGLPLCRAVGELRPAGEDVPAAFGVGQVFEWLREPEADFAGRGDGDGEVAERFIAGAVGFDPPPGAGPSLPPLGLGKPCGAEVVPGLRQPLPAIDHPRELGVPVCHDTTKLGAEVLQPALLLEAFRLGRISLGSGLALARRAVLAGERVAGRLGQSLLNAGDRRSQADDVPGLRLTSQPVLVVVARG